MKLPQQAAGYQAKLRRSLTRLRSNELRRDSPCLQVGSKPLAKTDHPSSKLQPIQAKANKMRAALKGSFAVAL
jgi:hypothetical protein